MSDKWRNILIIVGVVVIVGGVAWFKAMRPRSAASERATPAARALRSPSAASREASAPAWPRGKPTTEAAKGKLPRLVDLGAGKCIPCRMMAPILEEVKAEYGGRAEVEFIDVWQDPNAGRKYGIRLIPTQIFYDRDGKEAWRHEGFLSKERIVAKLRELGVR